MKTWLRWIFHLANVLVGGSGVVLAVMVYLLKPVDQWSIVNHPWQPVVQHAHVLAAPLMVFVFGILWALHVQPKWQSCAPEGRKTGLILAAMTPVMVVSGYLLQVSVDPAWRTVWEVGHLVSSAMWVVILAGHVVGRVKGEV